MTRGAKRCLVVGAVLMVIPLAIQVAIVLLDIVVVCITKSEVGMTTWYLVLQVNNLPTVSF